MRILVFGATGGTGRELVAQGLECGHEVTAFVRTPGKLSVPPDRIRVLQGDIAGAEAIRRAIPGHQAVLSALGTRSLGPTTLLSDGARAMVAAMERHGVRRILWESSMGVGDTRGQLGPLYNLVLIPLMLRNVFADKERQEAILRASGLDWTIVQPGMLTNGPRTGRYRVGPEAPKGQVFPRISRADVAAFMLEELVRGAWVRRSVALCY